MEKVSKNAGILGIGNLLLSDESFGIHVIEYLEKEYSFPESVTVLDGGTAGIYMAPFMEDHDPILIVDVVNLQDAVPGSLYSFTAEDTKNGSMQTRMSPHQLGVLEILDICVLRGIYPEIVEFYCVIPESIATGLEMSACVASQVEKTGTILVERLQELGHGITARKNGKDRLLS
jgi:hydrogenase maturation protease